MQAVENLFAKMNERKSQKGHLVCVEISRLTMRLIVLKKAGAKLTLLESSVHELHDVPLEHQFSVVESVLTDLNGKYEQDVALRIAINKEENVYQNINMSNEEAGNTELILEKVRDNLEIELDEYEFIVNDLGQKGVSNDHHNVLVCGITKELLALCFGLEEKTGMFLESVTPTALAMSAVMDKALTSPDEVIMVLRASIEHPRFFLYHKKTPVFIRKIDLIDRITDETAVRMAANEIQQSFSYFSFYVSQSSIKNVDRVLIYGHAQVGEWLKKELAALLNADVDMMDLETYCSDVEGITPETSDQVMASAGMALFDKKEHSFTKFFKRKKSFAEQALTDPLGLGSICSLVVVAILCAVLSVTGSMALSSAKDALKKEEKKLIEAQIAKDERLVEVKALESAIEADDRQYRNLQKDLKAVKSLETPGKKVVTHYEKLVANMPAKLRLTGLKYKDELVVRGVTAERDALAQFVKNLKASGYKVQKFTIQKIKESSEHEFNLAIK